ncbi:cation channel sperm-associated protein 1 [Pipistrellus kuhlii]|uniref:cation channel sperm-associated protein 1 n=1 Tax=Pipistrellus kuhlii TaxID=59472 RepID=UPI00174EF8B9|nr:cation channel sperm-associated protein 1 [Pipistrellus kuhlii]
MAGEAPNETDASNLNTLSPRSPPAPHLTPGHRRAHHHGESHPRGESQDSPDYALSRLSPQPSTSFDLSGIVTPSTVPSHLTYEKIPILEEHGHGGRRHRGRPRQRWPRLRGEPFLSAEYFQDSESGSTEPGGPGRPDADGHSKHHRHPTHHRRRPPRPGESSSHRGLSHSPSELRHSQQGEHQHGHHRHHGKHRRREHHYGEYPRVSSRDTAGSMARASLVFQPSVARRPSVPVSLMRSRTTVQSSASKVHPLEFFSKTSDSSPEEEQDQPSTNKTSRLHKKARSGTVCSKLCENCCSLFHGLRRMLRVLTESLFFDAFIFIVVCLNIVMLVAQTFAIVEVRGEWYFMVFDCIFLSIYVVEALLKIISMGFDYFYDAWNNLDFFIMIMAVLEFTLVQFNSRSLKRTVYNPNFFRIFKVFKSLRALRAIRVLRRLSILVSLQEVTGTLVRSMPSITAILVLMFTCLFLFSVVLRGLFSQSDPNRFQNIFTTLFTLFTLLTLDDWSLIYLDSRANGAWSIIPILMVYIVIQYFIFLNLVIAVLVDNFQMALLRGLEKVKQERAAQFQEKLLAESLMMLSEEEPREAVSDHTTQRLLIEKKFGTMTPQQQELLFHFLQLAAGVEHYQQKFRSQASVIDEIVDTAFEAGEEDFRK